MVSGLILVRAITADQWRSKDIWRQGQHFVRRPFTSPLPPSLPPPYWQSSNRSLLPKILHHGCLAHPMSGARGQLSPPFRYATAAAAAAVKEARPELSQNTSDIDVILLYCS